MASREQVKHLCKYCQQDMNAKAQVCHYCGRDQRRWINTVQYASNTTALVIVLAAMVQTYIANKQIQASQVQNHLSEEQYKESRLKRIEAEEVLKKAELNAKLAFSITSSNTHKTRTDSQKVLLYAKNTTQKAVEKSLITLNTAQNNVSEVKAITDTVRNELRSSKVSVAEQLTNSNKLIKKAENEFSSINNGIQKLKYETNAELIILKNRNELTALADNAITNGDRASYNKLNTIMISGPYFIPATSEILRIKNFFANFDRLKIAENSLHLAEMPTDVLLSDFKHRPEWGRRGAIAKHLGTRKEKKVVEALIENMQNETRLDVMKASLDSFSKLTGYKIVDVFDASPNLRLVEWWRINKEKVEKDLK